MAGVDSCVREKRYGPWLEKAYSAAVADGFRGTPWVRIDGKDLESPTVTNLAAGSLPPVVDECPDLASNDKPVLRRLTSTRVGNGIRNRGNLTSSALQLLASKVWPRKLRFVS